MNKLIFVLGLTILGWSMTSCGDGATKSSTATEKTSKSYSAKAAKIGGIDVPSFEDDNLNKFANKYASYLTKYEKAYKQMKNGNNSAFNSLSSEGQELAQLATKFSSNISENDAIKYSEYMQKISTRMQEIATK